METTLTVIMAVVIYLFIAGWVHFDTTPMLYDDSQLRRTAKLIVLLPIWIALFVLLIIFVIVGEYWEYLRSRSHARQQTYTT